MHQDLVGEQGATLGHDSVRRFLRRLAWVRPLPFRRLECAAGEEAQVEFGSGAAFVGAAVGQALWRHRSPITSW